MKRVAARLAPGLVLATALVWATALVLATGLLVLADGWAGAQETSPRYVALERRTPAQISPTDQTWLQSRHEDVVRAAAFFAIDLEQGSWSYQQSICPLLPNHLIVNYVRKESTGAETQFAATVPRNGEPVRGVAVQRNGLAPFSPAETSQNSVALFNRVWASEGGDLKTIEEGSNWVTVGLCYAEMVGSHPLVVSARPLLERNAGPPTLNFELSGGASTLFTDIGQPSQTWVWTLQFDRHGSLLHVDREKSTRPLLPQQTTAQTTPQPNLLEPSITIPVAVISAAAPAAESPIVVPMKVQAATVPGITGLGTTESGTTESAAPESAASGPPAQAPEVAQQAVAPQAAPAQNRGIRLLPNSPPPAGRPIPFGQAPVGRFIPGAQELPPPAPK